MSVLFSGVRGGSQASGVRAVILLLAALGTGMGIGGCRDGETGALISVAQAGTVEGAVRDDLGVGLSGVVVTLSDGLGDVRTATTDATGSFRFSAVDVGAWTLSIQVPVGFGAAAGETLQRQLDVGSAGIVRQDFRLNRL